MYGMKINTKNIVKGTTDPMQGLSALTKVAAFGQITSNQTIYKICGWSAKFPDNLEGVRMI